MKMNRLNIQKQLTNTQLLNSEYNKQIEKLHFDLEQQLKTTEQFQVFITINLLVILTKKKYIFLDGI